MAGSDDLANSSTIAYYARKVWCPCIAEKKKMVAHIKSLVRDVHDFPEEGVLFKDITPLLANADGFSRSVDLLGEAISDYRVDALVAIESRGFIFGSALSVKMGLPLQLIRKAGKLPSETVGLDYALEYGTDRIELHKDAIIPGQHYAVIDDLIATGGTAGATVDLINNVQGVVSCCAFVIELLFLNGRDKLNSPVVSLLQY